MKSIVKHLLFLLTTVYIIACSNVVENYQDDLKNDRPTDIIIAFDATGSMVDEKAWLFDNFESFVDNISLYVDDPHFAFISFRDYPFKPYGNPSYGDWPYRIEQNLTDSITDLKSAINSIVITGGEDWPESYGRVMYESYADTNISYRSNARRILIIIGDAIPHDNNIYEGVPELTTVRNTAVDPGRDGVVNTADDLDLQIVLSGLTDRDITLFMLLCPYNYNYSADDYKCWSYWCSLTGGGARRIATAGEMLQAVSDLFSDMVGSVD